MVVAAVAGWQVGLALAGFPAGGGGAEPLRYVLLLTLAGGALGLLVTPYLTLVPLRRLWAAARGADAPTLLGAGVGLLTGLLAAALAAFPVSLLPDPFGRWLPTGVAVLLAWLGVTVGALRKDDVLRALDRARRPAGRPRPDARPRSAAGCTGPAAGYQRRGRRAGAGRAPARLPGRRAGGAPLRPGRAAAPGRFPRPGPAPAGAEGPGPAAAPATGGRSERAGRGRRAVRPAVRTLRRGAGRGAGCRRRPPGAPGPRAPGGPGDHGLQSAAGGHPAGRPGAQRGPAGQRPAGPLWRPATPSRRRWCSPAGSRGRGSGSWKTGRWWWWRAGDTCWGPAWRWR